MNIGIGIETYLLLTLSLITLVLAPVVVVLRLKNHKETQASQQKVYKNGLKKHIYLLS